MATAEIDLYNLALSHIGISAECQATTENTPEANACRRFFTQVRDEILSEFPWPFARTFATLALIEADPTDEWGFAYQYPSDCLQMRRLLGGVRNEARQDRVPYLLGRGDSGRVIYTDLDDAVAEYTSVVEDTTQFDALFAQAVAFKLAYYIAPRLSAGDPYKLGTRAYQLYQQTMEQAASDAANEEQVEDVPDSEFIRARN